VLGIDPAKQLFGEKTMGDGTQEMWYTRIISGRVDGDGMFRLSEDLRGLQGLEAHYVEKERLGLLCYPDMLGVIGDFTLGIGRSLRVVLHPGLSYRHVIILTVSSVDLVWLLETERRFVGQEASGAYERLTSLDPATGEVIRRQPRPVRLPGSPRRR
jgi:hypothetical protein